MTLTKTAIVVLALVMISCTATDNRVSVADLTTSPYHETFAAAVEAASGAGNNILIDFYTDW